MKEALIAIWKSHYATIIKVVAVIVFFGVGYMAGIKYGRLVGFKAGHAAGLSDCPTTTVIPPSLRDSVKTKKGKKR